MAKKRVKYLTSTPKRSFIKALIWETISFVITLIAVYILQKDMGVSLKFTFALTIVKVIFLYNYERIWKKIMWGKVYAEINSRV